MLAIYINLERRTDRRDFMEAQCAALGLDVERLEATTPETIRDEDLAPLTMAEACEYLSPVEVASSISHFGAWKRMLEAGQRRVLVMEDDVRLSGMLPSFLSALEKEGPDIGLLRLETRMSRVLLYRRAEPAPLGLSLHRPLSYEYGCCAYVISADYAAPILASPQRFSMPADDILFSLESPFRLTSKLRAVVPALAIAQYEVTPDYCVPPSIVDSDLQAGRDVRVARPPPSRPRPRGLRKLRREILRVGRQIAGIPDVARRQLYSQSMIVPFAAGDSSGPRSGALPSA